METADQFWAVVKDRTGHDKAAALRILGLRSEEDVTDYRAALVELENWSG
jgi:hypothetical protein